jgi:hypothetical protein
MDFPYTPPANALQTWTLSGTVTSGTQGVVWFNGHCLGRQITSQPALFVPEAWLQPTNTIILVTQGGGAPQGYSLSPVEYHSLVKSPVGTTALKNDTQTPLAQMMVGDATLVSVGNKLFLPPGFAGKTGSLSIYDLQGHLVVGNIAVRNGAPVMPSGMAMPRGVLIAHWEK